MSIFRIKEIFRKNNVISIIYFDTSKSNALNIDSAFNLSKKQEAKIDRFLEMIKLSSSGNKFQKMVPDV
ncbi:MAG: hypothetical protein A2W22_02385 [Candidatus Levybacteria bacterium RBG_16_35_11]|nr:MAG: hypothetical protein A2W22_02385 [Candidatus Levybacteria bacterium RBG_16_35_11]